MPRLVSITLAISMLAACVAVTACAQSADPPLGDLARNLRRNQTPPPGVIDNDNLSQVMEAGASRNWGMVGLRFSLGQDVVQMVNASNPDVTCALSFNAKNRDPETTPKPQTLPDSELVKLDGPATIVDDALQLSVYNGTAWDLREITVGLTIVRPSSPAAAFYAGPLKLIPTAVNNAAPDEKHPDSTVLYHLRGTAAPLSTTLFRESLSTPIGPDAEWHWAIVQAKGMPPAPALPKPDAEDH
ncbi:MAG: hypothetical protein DMG70_30860 [Acidobacteria bacterium]|nr:MAG: hypothetical protein DMG70_30860 [Acidobacteriota bacterium]PYY05331.1 MAG: hypothetical protein DMG69_27320 [Acidobacteriota bacterium]